MAAQSPFVQALKEHNLTTYFLLPLIQLSKFSFGTANFHNSYINREGTVLTVEVIDRRLCDSFEMHPQYIGCKDTLYFGYFFFHLPAHWQEDFAKFKNGQYSKFSDSAKEMIRAFSGLRYKGDYNGATTTDARLMALERSPILKQKWEEELTVKVTRPVILPDDLELLDIPNESVYKEYE